MEAGHQDAFNRLLNAGIQAELVLGTIARKENNSGGGGHVLNIGFGMGLVDTAIQQRSFLAAGKMCFLSLKHMMEFSDTYGECYEDLREFHHHLPSLLKPGGIYSFFNGLCGEYYMSP